MLLDSLQHTSSRELYASWVKSRDLKLRDTVAANMRMLIDERAWSQEELGKKAKVSQRHISNMLNRKTGASFETLHAVAGAFGIPGWMLMIDRLSVDLLNSQKIPLLVASFRDAGPDGKALIEKLAEREAVHNREQTKVLPLRKPATG